MLDFSHSISFDFSHIWYHQFIIIIRRSGIISHTYEHILYGMLYTHHHHILILYMTVWVCLLAVVGGMLCKSDKSSIIVIVITVYENISQPRMHENTKRVSCLAYLSIFNGESEVQHIAPAPISNAQNMVTLPSPILRLWNTSHAGQAAYPPTNPLPFES